MSARITFPELAARLRRMADLRRVIAAKAPEIAAAAADDTRRRMAAGEAPDGSQQPPLKGPRRSRNTGPPLVDYGHLMGSATAEVDGAELVLRASGPGAQRHQEERPFLGLSDPLKKVIAGHLADGMAETLTGPGV